MIYFFLLYHIPYFFLGTSFNWACSAFSLFSLSLAHLLYFPPTVGCCMYWNGRVFWNENHIR